MEGPHPPTFNRGITSEGYVKGEGGGGGGGGGYGKKYVDGKIYVDGV